MNNIVEHQKYRSNLQVGSGQKNNESNSFCLSFCDIDNAQAGDI